MPAVARSFNWTHCCMIDNSLSGFCASWDLKTITDFIIHNYYSLQFIAIAKSGQFRRAVHGFFAMLDILSQGSNIWLFLTSHISVRPLLLIQAACGLSLLSKLDDASIQEYFMSTLSSVKQNIKGYQVLNDWLRHPDGITGLIKIQWSHDINLQWRYRTHWQEGRLMNENFVFVVRRRIGEELRGFSVSYAMCGNMQHASATILGKIVSSTLSLRLRDISDSITVSSLNILLIF